MQYDQPLGLNSVRELNPAMEAITATMDAQLSQVSPAALSRGDTRFGAAGKLADEKQAAVLLSTFLLHQAIALPLEA